MTNHQRLIEMHNGFTICHENKVEILNCQNLDEIIEYIECESLPSLIKPLSADTSHDVIIYICKMLNGKLDRYVGQIIYTVHPDTVHCVYGKQKHNWMPDHRPFTCDTLDDFGVLRPGKYGGMPGRKECCTRCQLSKITVERPDTKHSVIYSSHEII